MQQTHTLAPGTAVACTSPRDCNLQEGSQKMASLSDDLTRSEERRMQGERRIGKKQRQSKVRGEGGRRDGRKEGRRGGRRGGGREGGREEGREGGREGGKEGGKEGRKEGGKERGKGE